MKSRHLLNLAVAYSLLVVSARTQEVISDHAVPPEPSPIHAEPQPIVTPLHLNRVSPEAQRQQRQDPPTHQQQQQYQAEDQIPRQTSHQSDQQKHIQQSSLSQYPTARPMEQQVPQHVHQYSQPTEVHPSIQQEQQQAQVQQQQESIQSIPKSQEQPQGQYQNHIKPSQIQPALVSIENEQHPDPIAVIGTEGKILQSGKSSDQNNVVQPQYQEQAGPVPELELSDEEYRRSHEHVHLFDEEYEHHHNEGSHEQRRRHQQDDDVIVDEWAQYMNDFLPDMLVTFRLAARSDEYFYQEVGPEPTLIRGGYFVAGENNTGPIQFSLMGPKGEITLNQTQSEGLFHFYSDKPGTYAFAITNNNWIGDKFVTFVIGAGNETTLSINHVNSVNDNVVAVARMLRDIHGESQYLWSRQKSQMMNVTSNHSKMFWFSILELVIICGLAAVQVYLMKKLVSNRRIF